MKVERVPPSAVEEDHRLDTATDKASERLAKHRWHWTLDESHAERVSIKAYARAVGRASSLISKYVNGYAAWKDHDGVIPLSEAIERASVGVEKEAAIEAVAKARGLSFHQVRQTRPTEVKRVREAARDAAERKGTSVTDEVATVAEVVVRGEEADAQAAVTQKERHSMRWVEVESHLMAALRALKQAQTAITDVPFDDEERDLLRHSVEQVRQLLDLVDSRLSGNKGIDWDAELKKIMEGVN